MNYLYNTILLSVLLCASLLSTQLAAQERPAEERLVEVIRLIDRPWLGVQISDITADLADVHKLTRREGAYVEEVMKDSPADSAGFRAGDVIIKFGDREIEDADGLVRAVRDSELKKPVPAVILRDGRQQELTVVLRERPRRTAVRIPHVPDAPRILMTHRYGRLGVSVINLNPQLGEYFKVPDGKGVLVEKVHEGTPAEKAGIRAGDVIVKVNDRDIDTADRLRRVLSTYDPGDDVQLEIMREGSRRTVSARLEEPEFSEFYFPHIDRDEFEFEIFGPGGAEEFRRQLEESIRPGMEEFQVQMKEFRDKMKDFQIEFREDFMDGMKDFREHFKDISRTRRV